MRNQSGVTLTILVITIIIMALITGSLSYNSISSFKMNAYYNMISDIELLDQKIALYYVENNQLPITSETQKLKDIIGSDYTGTINDNPNNSQNADNEIVYKINLDLLGNLSLNNTEYYIDTTSHTIYSKKGIEIDGEVYFCKPLDYQRVNLSLYR